MKLAILHKEKCKPSACAKECKKYCPIEKKEADSCITIEAKALINEETCIGCSICQKRCPLGAIEIINLPEIKESDLVHRYGQNGFALYGLPTPRKQSVLGLLGRNGIGKTTAIKLLAGQEKINLGQEETSDKDIKNFFQGNEILRYLEDGNKKIAYKPQNLSSLAVNIIVKDLLIKRGSEEEIQKLSTTLEINHLLKNKLSTLSGGELQRVAILAASLGSADVYFFDEPLAFLDISQRLNVSDYIKKLTEGKTTIVVEHDLLILDYLAEHLNIFYGSQGAFGIVSNPKTSKEGVNAYLQGYLQEEKLRIRDKELNFNFTKNAPSAGLKIASWPSFSIQLDAFKLDVEAGDIRQNHVIGILGKNGTGKTTFVKALAGELLTSKGKLDLDLKVSYKPQYLFTDSEEIVREVMFKEKINKTLAQTFNIASIQDKQIKNLSGGELQRLSIARCLAKEADIYLFDEPSAYLDVEERISVAKAIKDYMVEKEKTAFVVDHDLLLVSYLADNIINAEGEPGKHGKIGKIKKFEDGITDLLKHLNITLRKDAESGRPRINKRGSVLDREQKERGEWAVL